MEVDQEVDGGSPRGGWRKIKKWIGEDREVDRGRVTGEDRGEDRGEAEVAAEVVAEGKTGKARGEDRRKSTRYLRQGTDGQTPP